MKPDAAAQAGSHRLLVLVAAGAVLLLVLAAVLHLALGGPAPLPSHEARAHALGEQLACPICQGESVADSPSALAEQMRAVIGEQIAAGQSDDQIVAYFVDRYGQGILLTPPQHGLWSLAWGAPLALLLAGLAGVGLAAYRWSHRPAADDALPLLTAEEARTYGAQLEQRLTAEREPPPAPVRRGDAALLRTPGPRAPAQGRTSPAVSAPVSPRTAATNARIPPLRPGE